MKLFPREGHRRIRMEGARGMTTTPDRGYKVSGQSLDRERAVLRRASQFELLVVPEVLRFGLEGLGIIRCADAATVPGGEEKISSSRDEVLKIVARLESEHFIGTGHSGARNQSINRVVPAIA